MTEVNKKRNKMIRQVQRNQRQSYLSQLRNQIIKQNKENQNVEEMSEILHDGLDQLQGNQSEFLNIYANLQSFLIKTISFSDQTSLNFKIAIFLFTSLSISDQVITYIVETCACRCWEVMISLSKINKWSELIYERMTKFLQIISLKYTIQSYHTLQFLEGELSSIFSQNTTKQLLTISPPIDSDSEYYLFISLYLSLVPASHIIPIFLNGYAFQSIKSPNHQPAITILGRLDLLSQQNPDVIELYNELKEKLQEQN